MAELTATTLRNRWPTALGLVCVGVGTAIILPGTAPYDLAPGVVAMAGMYMAAYAVGRASSVWIAFPLLVAVMVLLEVLDIDVSLGMAGILVLAWVWALARGHLHDGRWFVLQTAGMLGFGAITLVAISVDPTTGGVLVGVGFFLHGLWDIVHYRADKVVNRPWSEMCAVTDIPLGLLLVATSLAG